MPFGAVKLCKPCLNKKYPLRKQLLLSFLTLAAVSQNPQLQGGCEESVDVAKLRQDAAGRRHHRWRTDACLVRETSWPTTPLVAPCIATPHMSLSSNFTDLPREHPNNVIPTLVVGHPDLAEETGSTPRRHSICFVVRPHHS